MRRGARMSISSSSSPIFEPKAMAADLTVSTARIQKVFADLESQQTLISNCTHLWRTLSDHFSSLEKTLADRHHAIESKLHALDVGAQQTFDALCLRETSIPTRESAAAARIEERKLSALAEIEGSDVKLPTDVPGILRWYSRRMDSAGFWRFMVSRRKDLAVLRKEIADAVNESVDPARFVLDAVEDYVEKQPGDGAAPDRCWALGMLLRVLYDLEGGKEPEVSGRIRERAAKVAEIWRAKVEGEGGKMVGSEAQMLLQIVVAFGLQHKLEQELLRKLVVEFASRKEMPKLAAGLGFGEKLADIIDELGTSGKELEAVYFAYESGIAEQFSPATLLKTYLQNSRKNANAILKNGNHSSAAMEESSNMELNALRAIIKCVETYKLEKEFSIDGLKKRVTQLDKAKVERKKNATGNKPPIKRRKRNGAAAPLRPAKAAKISNVSYASFHQNPPVAPQVGVPRHSYSYPGQVGLDGPTSVSYGVAAHRWSPNSASQQYHLAEELGSLRSSVPYGGSSGTYGSYDYAGHAASAQPPAYPR